MEIKDINIFNMLPINIDNIIIEPDLTLKIPNNYIGENIAHWKKSRGGIFLKDLKDIKKDIKHNYVEIKTEDSHYIAKILNEEELDNFSHCKVHQINAVYYIKILNLIDEENPNSKLIDDEIDEDIVINTEPYSIPLEDEEIEKSESLNNLSLFD